MTDDVTDDVTPEQRDAARLVVQIDRDRQRPTNPQVLAVASARPRERRPGGPAT